MPDLSVVIVNYNTVTLLRACLASLLAQPTPCEIIVVDNASQDGSVAMVQREFPQVRLLAQAANTWYCGGNNLGAAAASGDTVLFLNPDTVVTADALGAMLAFLRTHPTYAGVTCQLRYPDGRLQYTGSRIPTYRYLLVSHTPLLLLTSFRQRLSAHHWYSDWARTTDHDIEVAPGSCLLLRREDAHMNPDLRLYFPEDSLAQRLRRPVRYLSSVHIEHHEKAATTSWLATRIYFDDLLIYTGQQHGQIGRLLLWVLSRPLLGGMWLKQRLRAKPA